MKAKDLAAILLQNPEMEVVLYEFDRAMFHRIGKVEKSISYEVENIHGKVNTPMEPDGDWPILKSKKEVLVLHDPWSYIPTF